VTLIRNWRKQLLSRYHQFITTKAVWNAIFEFVRYGTERKMDVILWHKL